MSDSSDGSGGQKLGVTQSVVQRLEREFANSHLPATMALPRRYRLDILKRLGGRHPGWPFEDRVLVWLLPNMERESRDFHSAQGGDLSSVFTKHQLAHIDESLTEELLARLET